MSEAQEHPRPEEARREAEQNRPYRRFVVAVFFLILIAVSVFVLRGIIRRLDRLPSLDTLHKADVVDDRALRACAEDLIRLEERIRTTAGIALSHAPAEEMGGPDSWPAIAEGLELDRLRVVAQCRLDEASEDAVAEDLQEATGALQDLLRSYNLLYGRHQERGFTASAEAREAARRALQALKAR